MKAEAVTELIFFNSKQSSFFELSLTIHLNILIMRPHRLTLLPRER